jgi:hypothetical protein
MSQNKIRAKIQRQTKPTTTKRMTDKKLKFPLFRSHLMHFAADSKGELHIHARFGAGGNQWNVIYRTPFQNSSFLLHRFVGIAHRPQQNNTERISTTGSQNSFQKNFDGVIDIVLIKAANYHKNTMLLSRPEIAIVKSTVFLLSACVKNR